MAMDSADEAGGPADRTSVMFVNHASLLIRKGGRYLLTDPWHQRPAFGSWLPTFPQYVHPAYLAALGGNLSILISHGHDDHCDDELLAIFAKDTEIVTADYGSPSVLNRLKKLGFENIKAAPRDGVALDNGFFVKAYVNPDRSDDDATLTIDTGSGFVVHCNDNWFEFGRGDIAAIAADRAKYSNDNIAFFSQTNSASGYPLNYRSIDDDRKVEILKSKVRSMVVQGMRNAEALGLTSFYSYAGFASVFVKDKPEYLELGLVPTAPYIRDQVLDDEDSRRLSETVRVRDFYPGDVLDLSTGRIAHAFISHDDYRDHDLKEAAFRYYENYRLVEQCDTYRAAPDEALDLDRFVYFIENFNAFAAQRIARPGNYGQAEGKLFEIHVHDADVRGTIIVGKEASLGPSPETPNKRLIVDAALMNRVTRGEILFENLYTGYEGEWERFPPDVYNRDLIMLVVMFSYVYKNRLVRQFPGK